MHSGFYRGEYLIEKKVDPMDPPAEIRKEIGEFYDYFAANFGDSDEVMGAIQQKWGPQPPAVLIIGFQGMFEKGEKAIAEKYDLIVIAADIYTSFSYQHPFIPFASLAVKVGLCYLVSGALIGSVGTVISTRKYVKV